LKLYEFQAKKAFAQGGIPVPRGEVVQDPDGAVRVAEQLGRVVVKAQVHVGGRGKAGGIKLAGNPAEARQYADGMLGKPLKGFTVNYALVEEALDIAKEYYLGITIDRNAEKAIIMLSSMGGVDIEEVAATTPEKIAKLHADPAWGHLGLPAPRPGGAGGSGPEGESRHRWGDPQAVQPVPLLRCIAD